MQQAIVNTADQRANGLELETTVLPMEHWLITGSLGWLDTKYTTFYGNVFGTGNGNYSALDAAVLVEIYDAAGDLLRIRPPGSWYAGAGLSYSYQSKYYTDPTNSPVGLDQGYGLLDASLTYEDPRGRYKLAFWGKNLTDTLYGLAAVPSSGYFTQLYLANPRTFGMGLTFKMQEK